MATPLVLLIKHVQLIGNVKNETKIKEITVYALPVLSRRLIHPLSYLVSYFSHLAPFMELARRIWISQENSIGTYGQYFDMWRYTNETASSDTRQTYSMSAYLNYESFYSHFTIVI